jgi:hypothetical protein
MKMDMISHQAILEKEIHALEQAISAVGAQQEQVKL